jgi:ABC-2 type transport system permease protein
MNKTGLVIQREYLTRVKKKSFLVFTILIPTIIIGFYVGLFAVSLSGNSSSEHIAVIDKAGIFDGKDKKVKEFTFHIVPNDQEPLIAKQYDHQGYDGYLLIPSNAVDTPSGMHFQRISEAGSGAQGDLNEILAGLISHKRMEAAHIDSQMIRQLTPEVSINATVGTEARQSVSEVARWAGFAAGFLIYFILLIYGTMVMRGVTEEKTTRIAEVIVSSVKPFQLMMGKIIGIGAVGLTQFLIWGILLYALQLLLPLAWPALGHSLQNAGPQGAGGYFGLLMHQIAPLNFTFILLCFLFYFLGGYLLFASLFAAVGSSVSDDAQEAQQMVMPITLIIVFSLVLMVKASADPNSSLAVFGSLFPLTSPIVMMGRIPYGVPTIPLWQIATSMILLVGTFFGTTWVAGKIYRTGILLYGKKVTLKEMLRWASKRN